MHSQEVHPAGKTVVASLFWTREYTTKRSAMEKNPQNNNKIN